MAGTRSPGRPRSEQARRSVLGAAAQLIEDQGYGRLTMERIARTAGVSRQTVYRWWSSPAEMAHRLAQEGAPHGVSVNVVAPALIDTDALPDDEEAREALAKTAPVGRLGQPSEAADLVAAIVRNGYITGQSILLDGGRHPT
jgi:AcrR family transcriptional regulator